MQRVGPGPDETQTELSSPAKIDFAAGLVQLGLEQFRPGQREAIETLLEIGRLLLVAPTGGGKSLVYQLPASQLPGTTLVISPLVALMHDQVEALDACGVPATYLASTLTTGELRARMAAAARGELRLLYVAPERLAFEGFRALLKDLACPLIAIDEAHCISEWGHDFRPDYLQIGALLSELPAARVLACTATATPVVRDEIIARLALPHDTPQLVRGFARPNLALRAAEVRTRREREAAVDAVLAETLEAPGRARGCAIVYAPTRRASEEEGARLRRAGWQADAYHAGLSPSERESVHRRFALLRSEIVVATNAFGMGIDRADVRCVAHLAPPSSPEAYYQEVGRAGRDGQPAVGLMLSSPGDLPLRRHLIESGSGGEPPSPEVVQHKWQLFLELMRWAEGGSCRHDAILRYFGDEEETLSGCGRCDVCLRLADEQEVDPELRSLLVRKGLSAVARIHRRFGLAAAVKLLRGAEDPRLRRTGLDLTRTFGILSEYSEEWLLRLLRRTVTAGWVDFEGGERPVAVLTEDGAAVMRGERAARLLLPELDVAARRSLAKPRSGDGGGARVIVRRRRARADDELALGQTERALFEALRRERSEWARVEAVPPYVVASDRTLRDIARLRPATLADLRGAHGIGDMKLKRYGERWLRVVAEHMADGD